MQFGELEVRMFITDLESRNDHVNHLYRSMVLVAFFRRWSICIFISRISLRNDFEINKEKGRKVHDAH